MTIGTAEIVASIAIGAFLMNAIATIVVVAVGWGRFSSAMSTLTDAVEKLDMLIGKLFHEQGSHSNRITRLETLAEKEPKRE